MLTRPLYLLEETMIGTIKQRTGMRVIRISSCKECPFCKYDNGWDALFCEAPGNPKAVKLTKMSEWKDFEGVHKDCPLTEEWG